jgi:hypothetical protein
MENIPDSMIGATVQVRTVLGETAEGQIFAFDKQTEMLVLRIRCFAFMILAIVWVFVGEGGVSFLRCHGFLNKA